ncbi:LuxR family maltose regulon positive regulatory protein [Rhodococcus sp. OK519]|uniref:LuxR C-terminal-related transcriptional regulator n=1 Tax=Rhodococcus sp. OK519 TaxID=2135729 RepID=UPI000D4862B4|nr:LuxR family maltose regulon positive regulatory protein [Rhodococcus sp. OK519]
MSIVQGGSFAASTEIPVLRSDRVVSRTRLFEVLDCAFADHDSAGTVVLVCAPAGSGKTTFLADWAHRVGSGPGEPIIAWASVDDGHNAPHALRTELARALADAGHSRLRDNCTPALDPVRGQDFTFESALNGIDESVWLVVDDAHLIHEPNALSQLEMLLRAPPDRLQVVVCCRFEPPLAFQKLRLDGRVLDVTFNDLAFTSEEATAMLAEHDVELDDHDLTALMGRTEGWAAGLRLAGMSLAGHPDPSTLIENFSGCRRAVADYLIEQVLSGQSEEIRQFLVKTSVPETFSAALAEELTGCSDAHAIIDLLEHRNFLITRIETTPTQFRYHPLLRSYLRAEISLLGRRAVAELEHVTARWYARFGDALLALEHGVTAGEASDVESVLSKSGLALVLDGHGEAIERLLARAPQCADQTITRLVRAAAHLHADNPTVAAGMLGTADIPAPDGGTDFRTSLLEESLRMQIAVSTGDFTTLTALAGPPANLSGDVLLDAFAALQRGRVHLRLGRLDSAADNLSRARAHARESDAPRLVTQTSIALGIVALSRGQLGDAHALAVESRSTATDTGSSASSDGRAATLLEALCHYLRNDTRRAVELVGFPPESDPPSYPDNAVAAALFGIDTAPDRRIAVAALHSAGSSGRPASHPPGLIAACLPSIQFAYLHIGETIWARELVTNASTALGQVGDVQLLEAVLHLCTNQLERARAVLLPILEGELPCAAATNTVTAWLVEAELARRRSHDSRAHDALGEALRLAEPEGVLRPFHDMASATVELLSTSRGRFGSRDRFADTVWASLPRTPATTAEKLTRRELQLLAELPTWRTAEEIAADLCVSVNTVKTHLRGIYRKLGVTTRRDAVNAAHTHGLL